MHKAQTKTQINYITSSIGGSIKKKWNYKRGLKKGFGA